MLVCYASAFFVVSLLVIVQHDGSANRWLYWNFEVFLLRNYRYMKIKNSWI